jgi:hypothetical protein
MALQRGWKTELDFPDIERRLKQKKSVFDALIDDGVGLSNDNGPRQHNIFWLNAVVSLGHGGGLAGTFKTFDQIQPG